MDKDSEVERVYDVFESPAQFSVMAANTIGRFAKSVPHSREDAEKYPGRILSRADLKMPLPIGSRIVQGIRPRPEDVFEGCFMERRSWIDVARNLIRAEVAKLEKYHGKPSIPIFWITGPSGAGKSVPVLHLMRDLLTGEVDIANYLGEFTDLLPKSLKY